MITTAELRHIRYHPEKLPFSWTGSLVTGDNPPLVDLVRLTQTLILSDVSLIPHNAVTLKLFFDKAYPDIRTFPLKTLGEFNPFFLEAHRTLRVTLHATTPVPDYQFFTSFWVLRPTVAQKLLWGLTLDPIERDLDKKLGVSKSVEKGILPFPLEYQIKREYIGRRLTYSRLVTNAPAGEATIIDTLRPNPGQFVVLEGFSIEKPAAVAQNVQIWISRDEDKQWLKVPCFPLDLGYDISCFIPALDELQLELWTEAALTNVRVRYTIGRYKLTNLLRARWFPEEMRAEFPDLVDSALGGVLP